MSTPLETLIEELRWVLYGMRPIDGGYVKILGNQAESLQRKYDAYIAVRDASPLPPAEEMAGLLDRVEHAAHTLCDRDFFMALVSIRDEWDALKSRLAPVAPVEGETWEEYSRQCKRYAPRLFPFRSVETYCCTDSRNSNGFGRCDVKSCPRPGRPKE